MSNRPSSNSRAVSPVVSVILVVAISVLLSAAVGHLVFGLGNTLGDSDDASTQGSVRIGSTQDSSTDAIEITVITSTSELFYQINDSTKQPLGTVGDSTILIEGTHYTPGDTITIYEGNQVIQTIHTEDYNTDGTTVSNTGTPNADATASAKEVTTGTTVSFDASTSTDPENDPLSYEWEFTGDTTPESTSATTTHTYSTSGTHTANVTVTDADGNTDSYELLIVVGDSLSTSGLLSHYGFNETSGSTLIDHSGNNYDGDNNGATLGATGFVDPAYDFAGGDWVNIPNYGTSYETFTVTAWVQIDTVQTQGFVSADTSGGVRHFQFRQESNGKLSLIHFGNNGGTLESTDTLQTGKWYFVSATNDGSTATLYINASSNGSEATDMPARDPSYGIGIDERANRGNPFDGRIDDVRLYNRALSASELNTIYTAETDVPTASATANSGSTKIGGEVSFDATESTDPDDDALSYTWDFEDGTVVTGATPSHTFNTTGTHTVRLVAEDPDGNIDTDTITIEVYSGTTMYTTTFSSTDGWTQHGDSVYIDTTNEYVDYTANRDEADRLIHSFAGDDRTSWNTSFNWTPTGPSFTTSDSYQCIASAAAGVSESNTGPYHTNAPPNTITFQQYYQQGTNDNGTELQIYDASGTQTTITVPYLTEGVKHTVTITRSGDTFTLHIETASGSVITDQSTTATNVATSLPYIYIGSDDTGNDNCDTGATYIATLDDLTIEE